MVSFLLIISFLLHLITLTAIFQLLKKIQKLEDNTNSIDVVVAMEQTLEEIKEENNRFERLLKERAKKPQVTTRETENKHAANRQDTPSERELKINPEKEQNGDEDIAHLIGENLGYEVEASLESRVLQLYEEGRTIETIAKTLDCGKTEAELIIKMYGK